MEVISDALLRRAGRRAGLLIFIPVSIIPVIDLQGGLVVRGIAGRRAAYRPVRSRLAADARPATVARALAGTFGFRRVYVADLDAIAGAEPDAAAWREIADCGLSLLLDAGVGDGLRARAVLDLAASDLALEGVVVGLESVADVSDLPSLVELLGPASAVFSIDLQEGRPFSTRPAWQAKTACEAADVAVKRGFRRLIVLDLASVGCGAGPTVAGICRAVRQAHPGVDLMAGGGVRDIEDVRLLAEAGCDGVLVASALHDGRVQPGDIAAEDVCPGSASPRRAGMR